MKRHSSIQTISSTHQPTSITNQNNSDNAVIVGLVITIPLLIGLSIVLRRRHRKAVLQNQIKRLEKLWQINATRG